METPAATLRSTDAVYPIELADRDGWTSSTITTPISPLEFDLRARAFARGFSRALRDLLGVEVDVGVRRAGGYLFTLVSARGAHPIVDVPTGLQAHDNFLGLWLAHVKPATIQLLDRLANASQGPLDMSAVLLEQVSSWLEELTYLHHTMLLPARVALSEFAEMVVDEGLMTSQPDALALLAGQPNATTMAAQRLWDSRHLSRREPPPVGGFLALVAETPQEGEGYGLRHPGWLEDAAVALAIARCYASAEPECAPDGRLRLMRAGGLARQADVNRCLTRHPAGVAERFARLLRRARSAVAVTEDHAPLMHARVGFELRQFVRKVGARLVRQGVLDDPDDVVFLHVDEIVTDGRGFADLVEARRREADVALVPAADSQKRLDADTLGSSRLAGYVGQVYGGQSTPVPATAGALHGEPASSGRARGRVRRLSRHADLGDVRCGEIVVAPNNSAIWSFALPVASAVVVPGGSRFGHLATLARDYGRPAIVAIGRGLDQLRDGDLVEVDGDGGTLVQEFADEGSD